MKRAILSLLITLIVASIKGVDVKADGLCVGDTTNYQYTIKGRVLQGEYDMYTDSVIIRVGKDVVHHISEFHDGTYEVKGEKRIPAIATIETYIKGSKSDGPSISGAFILEPGILIRNKLGIGGTPLNDAINNLTQSIIECLNNKGYNNNKGYSVDGLSNFSSLNTDTQDSIKHLLSSFYDKHKDDVAVTYLRRNNGIGHFLCLELMQIINPELATPTIVKDKEGSKYIDFAVEHKGQITKLSDYVGKGKYVLVEFWASWCGPCREEIPNLIRIHDKYKDKNLTVLGIAVWDKSANAEKLIQEMEIPYPQIIDVQRVSSEVYHVEAIPEIILFSPDGTMLKSGLRGDKIEEAIKEHIK